MRTRIGTRSGELIERAVLSRMPGYPILKTLSRSLFGVQEGCTFSVAAVSLRDSEVLTLGFNIEEHEYGDLTVFVPSAPTPSIGSIPYVKRERVCRLLVSR